MADRERRLFFLGGREASSGLTAAVAMRIVVRMNVRTNLLLPRDVVEEVDRYAGPRGRSRYVTEALEEKLRRDRLREVLRRTRGAWRDHPDFPTSESVATWVRERRLEPTDTGKSG